MLKITFTIPPSESALLSGFEYGDIQVRGNLGGFTTDEFDKTFMLSFAIISLLDGIENFMTNRSINKFRWETLESFLVVSFFRKSNNQIEVARDNLKISLLDEKTLIGCINASISEFLEPFLKKLPPDSAIFQDITDTFNKFKFFARSASS